MARSDESGAVVDDSEPQVVRPTSGDLRLRHPTLAAQVDELERQLERARHEPVDLRSGGLTPERADDLVAEIRADRDHDRTAQAWEDVARSQANARHLLASIDQWKAGDLFSVDPAMLDEDVD
jgi:PHD/YefM family antitoxin component YafN of YafNO toxin-antitoxin module